MGNGAGSPPKSELITKDKPIELPDEEGLEAPEEGMVFVGWNDGLLTYPPEYQYTVTKNVTFNARWAFTTLDKITTHLTKAGTDTPVLIAVYGGAPPNSEDSTSLTWKNLLLAIETAGKDQKSVELDLTGSTLALFEEGDEKKFDYKDGGSVYGTGEKYIKKLVLPSAATLITTYFNGGPFSSLEAVSGLKVSAISDGFFAYIKTLAAVVFPAAISIGNSAFVNCSSLASVSLPAATSIDSSAFNGCSSLTAVVFPAATSIGNSAFYDCFTLTSVSLPAVESIGTYAFYQCYALPSVSLDKVETISNNAFRNCSSLTSVNLPAATSIDSSAFYNCTALASVSLDKAGIISNDAFTNCHVLTSVNLPAATSISSSAFYQCYVLAVITIAGGCTIDDTTIRGGFQTYYNSDNEYGTKAAGVYTYSSDSSGISSWSYAPPK
jgi:hypothetical protein